LEVPLELTFRDIEKTDELVDLVNDKVASLEKVCDYIISCHTAIEKPQEHQRMGNPYRVRVNVRAPPGHEIVVKREPSDGDMHEPLDAVIRDVFAAAQRKLKELVEKQRNEVKTHPDQEELAMGSIAQGEVRFINDDIVQTFDIPARVIDKVAEVEKVELRRRLRKYQGSRDTPDISGKTALLVDDGLATGASMLAAIKAVKKLGPKKVIAAVPVAPVSKCRRLEGEADPIVCMHTCGQFISVGQWYENFPQVSDEEVTELMQEKRPV
jgi:predicted phosphoribosyltransferase